MTMVRRHGLHCRLVCVCDRFDCCTLLSSLLMMCTLDAQRPSDSIKSDSKLWLFNVDVSCGASNPICWQNETHLVVATPRSLWESADNVIAKACDQTFGGLMLVQYRIGPTKSYIKRPYAKVCPQSKTIRAFVVDGRMTNMPFAVALTAFNDSMIIAGYSFYLFDDPLSADLPSAQVSRTLDVICAVMCCGQLVYCHMTRRSCNGGEPVNTPIRCGCDCAATRTGAQCDQCNAPRLCFGHGSCAFVSSSSSSSPSANATNATTSSDVHVCACAGGYRGADCRLPPCDSASTCFGKGTLLRLARGLSPLRFDDSMSCSRRRVQRDGGSECVSVRCRLQRDWQLSLRIDRRRLSHVALLASRLAAVAF